MGTLLAVVDDEQRIIDLVTVSLEQEGFTIRGFLTGPDFLASIDTTLPDLVLLDIRMPGMDGFEVCRRVRAEQRTARLPVVFLSAQDEVINKVVGLEIGADDFVSKPFHPKELGARVRAVLRRTASVETSCRTIGGLELDIDRFEARCGGKRLALTTAEFRILRLLSDRPGVVLSRERLIDGMWDGERVVTDRTIDVHVRRLREKLGPCAHLVQTVRGVGYKIQQ
ncbi:MAG: response regulator transcription factor [Candidatus Eisenbacteria bacterium]|jgi:DNA-binding response OmpR family regulator|nr:response regulator transcription factor [Candidatus Eisenbacteria bacterium]